MNSRAGFLAVVSVLALACSGSSNNGGTGGAGSMAGGPGVMPGGNMGGNNAPLSSGVGLGTDQAPNDTEQAPNETDQAPNGAEQVANSTDQAPNNTDQAGDGDCAAACQAVAERCGTGGTAEDGHQCVAFCNDATLAGCTSQFTAAFNCVADMVCSGQPIDEGTFTSIDSPCFAALLSLYECNPGLADSGGEVHVVDGQPPVDNGSGPTVDEATQLLCETNCPVAVQLGCRASVDGCVAECVADVVAFNTAFAMCGLAQQPQP